MLAKLINNKSVFPTLLLGGISLLAILVLLYATAKGIGLGFDSVAYISAARNLISGLGLGRLTCIGFKPMTLWPPFYPVVLSCLSLLKIDAIQAARLVSAVGFGLTVLLMGLCVAQVFRFSYWGILAAVLVLVSSPILNTFTWAMSESLYLPLAMGALFFMGTYFKTRRDVFLVLGSVVIGLACMTRYVGISLLACAGLLLLLDRKTNLRKKFLSMGLLAGLGFLPLVVWSVRNRIVVGSATNRVLTFHPPDFEDVDFLVKQIFGWFLPDRWAIYRVRLLFTGSLAIFLFIAALICLVWWLKKQKTEQSVDSFSVLVLLLLYTVLYPLTILSTNVFITPSVNIVDDRILSPFLVCLATSIVCGACLAWRRNGYLVRLGILLLIAHLLIMNSQRQWTTVISLHSQAQGYAGDIWQQSGAGPLLQALPTNMIYTNDIQAVYFISGKPACILPMKETDLDAMRTNLREEEGVVVIFGQHLPEFLPLEQITDGMQVIYRLPDIVVYQYPEQ